MLAGEAWACDSSGEPIRVYTTRGCSTLRQSPVARVAPAASQARAARCEPLSLRAVSKPPAPSGVALVGWSSALTPMPTIAHDRRVFFVNLPTRVHRRNKRDFGGQSWDRGQNHSFTQLKPRFLVAHDLPTMPTILDRQRGKGSLHSSPACAYSTGEATLRPTYTTRLRYGPASGRRLPNPRRASSLPSALAV
jgi:hypothetical protein